MAYKTCPGCHGTGKITCEGASRLRGQKVGCNRCEGTGKITVCDHCKDEIRTKTFDGWLVCPVCNPGMYPIRHG